MRAIYVLSGAALGFLTVTQSMRAFELSMSPPAPKVVRTPPARIRPLPKDLDRLTDASRDLAKADVARLRARIAKEPGDAPARAMLMEGTIFSRDDKAMGALHREQAIWFAANLPGSPALNGHHHIVDNVLDAHTYDLMKRLFEEALAKRPKDPDVKANYADLILIPEKPRAIELLESAARLDPKNPVRLQSLAHAHSLASRGLFGRRDRAEASKAVDLYLKARSLGGDANPSHLIESAFDANRLDVVTREANAVLKDHSDADAVHSAHTVLGRVALKRGDVAAAKGHLLDSAKVSGSPVLGSFGPDMELAQELLAKGERSTVLAYLKATGRFWQDERQVRWTKTVADGGTPDWD